MHKFESILQGNFTSTGRIKKPPHSFYLKLVAEVVDALNNKLLNGIPIARKAMIMCGLVPNVDGIWSPDQLTSELRKIVQKHQAYFDGLNPNPAEPQ